MADKSQPVDSARLMESGFAQIPNALDSEEIDGLLQAIHEKTERRPGSGGSDFSARNLLRDVAAIRDLSGSDVMTRIARSALGQRAFPARAIFFDKVTGANWHVGWHQDTMIPVAERKNAPGFGPWSVKAGVVHVKPPADVLSSMLALRVHLDDCGPDNGPLRVLPGSHRYGILSSKQVQEWIATGHAVTCTACRGDVLAMRPLLLHASSRAACVGHRRVIHIEYAAAELPCGLRWGMA